MFLLSSSAKADEKRCGSPERCLMVMDRWTFASKITAAVVDLRYACMLQLYMYRVPAPDPRVWVTTVSGPAGTSIQGDGPTCRGKWYTSSTSADG